MLGQIGLAGGGFGVSYHYDDGGSLSAKAPGIVGISSGDNPSKSVLPFERVTDMLLQPNQPFDYNGQTMTYPDITRFPRQPREKPARHTVGQDRDLLEHDC